MEKKTKKQYYNELKEQYSLTQEHIDFINKQIELLDRKRVSKNGKLTPAQELANTLKEQILEIFQSGKKYTATELVKELQPSYDETLTNQRISSVLKKMVDEDCTAAKVKDGRKTLFYGITD